MSEREVYCDFCKSPANCVDKIDNFPSLGTKCSCDEHCDHKAPHKCLPIVRYERGKEFDT